MSGRGEENDWGRSDPGGGDLERNVSDEIAFHLEMRIRENVARGMSEESARAAAKSRFGNAAQVRRELLRMGSAWRRARRRRDALGGLARELDQAARGLRRRPVFAVVTVLTLALGIGAGTAVYGVAEQVLLRPVPGVRDPASLHTVSVGTVQSPEAAFAFSHNDYLAMRESAVQFGALAASQEIDVNVWLGDATQPRRLGAEYVSDNYGSVLGLRPLAGRVPGPRDRSDPRVVMISARLWREAFGEQPGAVGSVIRVNGTAVTVVGVAPPGFHGTSLLSDTELWVPVEARTAVLRQADSHALEQGTYPIWMQMVGRLGEGATATQAREQLRAAAARIGADPSSMLPESALPLVRPGIGLSAWERDQLTTVLTLLGGAAALLLLLAYANAANLLLAHHAGRSTELAIRRAIGAGRGRIARLLVAESTLFVLLAGVSGVGVAVAAVTLFRGERFLTFMPPLGAIELNGRVLLFALGLSLVTVTAFGAIPAFLAASDSGKSVRASSRHVTRRGPSAFLVVAQVAISVTLVIGAGLLLNTVLALRSAELGFRPAGVLEVSVDPGSQGYEPARRARFYEALLDGARDLPAVREAGLAWIPIQGRPRAQNLLRPEGLPQDDPRALPALSNQVSPGFLATVGMELLAGRDFLPDEMMVAVRRVAVISESAARHLFPEGDALRRRLDVGRGDGTTVEVVGIVRDARVTAVRDPAGALFFEPLGQGWGSPGQATLYVRGRDGLSPDGGALSRLVRGLDPALPVYDVQPLTRRVAASAAMERVLARLVTVFAGLALVLAAAGLYGLMAIVVQRRTREIGIRVALGATPDRMRRMVIARGVGLTVVGIAAGILASTRLTRLIEARLWGVRPLDPFVFAMAAATLIVTSVVACWGPGARATRVDPVEVLSEE